MRRRDRRLKQTAAVNEIVLFRRVIYRILMNCVVVIKLVLKLLCMLYLTFMPQLIGGALGREDVVELQHFVTVRVCRNA